MSFSNVWSWPRQIPELVGGGRRGFYEDLILYFPGSTMFAGISSLLKFLRKSFQIELNRSSNMHHERQFQTAVINGISKTETACQSILSLTISCRRFRGEITGFSNDGNLPIHPHFVSPSSMKINRMIPGWIQSLFSHQKPILCL